jgi:hypothetical protein
VTGEEAAKAIYDGVNAMFAAHETVTEGEQRAYVERIAPSGDLERYVFTTFVSGRQRSEDGRVAWLNDHAQEVALALEAVAQCFPDHATQRALWRREPMFDTFAATKASRKFHTPAEPERSGTYFRLVAMPLEARKFDPAERDG